ncbi:unnamed protein product [Coregonus sp. 'balchen']|nr:unnamed protein product [Coregonus sp. 'balchen']
MEIGTEISKKIRAAIKGKLQELGAYVDEELPDYIMVMVANKKTSQQMSDDLALFLGNNTITFTFWLHGVLEKLRSVAVEPASLRSPLYSDTSAGKSERKGGGSQGLAVSSLLSDRTEARVSSSAHEHRRVSSDKTSSSRLTSTVKPLVDSSEAVIDIKPELDDDLIGEDPVDMGVLPGRLRGSTSGGGGGGGRASAQIYRPPQGRLSSGTGRSADAYRSSEGSSESHSRQQHGSQYLDSRSSRDGRVQQQEGVSRKRRAPVVSSVVRVNQTADEGPDSDELEEEEEDDEEDEGYGVKSMSSRVSLPSKPERKPSLPPAKQANKNLLMRAIAEAQISINKTTAYPAVPEVAEGSGLKPFDTRSFIVRRSELGEEVVPVRSRLGQLEQEVPMRTRLGLEEVAPPMRGGLEEVASPMRSRREETIVPMRSRLGAMVKEEFLPATPRMVQPASREKSEAARSASPKFIVTLDGVPSPLGNLGDCDMEADDSWPFPAVSLGTNACSSIRTVNLTAMPPPQSRSVCRFFPECKKTDCLFYHPKLDYKRRATETD